MGTLAAALAAHTLIGLDTNPFIYLWERHARYFPLAEDLFRSRQIRLLPIDAVLARRAIVLRAQYDIHVPDALQIVRPRP